MAHSGRASAPAARDAVRYVEFSAISRPPPRAAPLRNAKDGTAESPRRPSTRCPTRATSSACSRSVITCTPLRSAPAATQKGLPVMPIAATPGTANAASMAASMLASVCGPSVLGLVWSWPLSSVMSARVPAPSGSSTSRTLACVTTSV